MNQRSHHLHAVVLAAGASSRFGSPKQLVRFEGQPLLLRVLSLATELAGSAVSVVLGANAAEIVRVLPTSTATTVVNRDWHEGLASSIRAAVQRLPGSCDGVMLMLADQPLISSATLERLAATWRKAPRSIVASVYGEVVGVPAIFPRWSFNDLMALRGDQGARLLINRFADHVVRVDNPEAAVDIDYAEDLLDLRPT
jgi:molybdenum cofactor cytidylyltransferase